MAKYILKRLAQSLLTIFLVVCVVFLLMRLLPNDYYFTEEQLIKLSSMTSWKRRACWIIPWCSWAVI